MAFRGFGATEYSIPVLTNCRRDIIIIPVHGFKMFTLIYEFYIERQPFFWIKDMAFIACFLLLFFDKFSLKNVCAYFAGFIAAWLFVILMNWLLLSTVFPSVYIYLLCLLLLYAVYGRRHYKGYFICCLTYWTAYVYLSVFAKSVGSILFRFEPISINMYSYVFMPVITVFVLAFYTVIMKFMPIVRYPSSYVRPSLVVWPFVLCVISNGSRFLADNIQGTGTPVLTENSLTGLMFVFILGLIIYIFDIFCYVYCYNKIKTAVRDEHIECRIFDVESLKNNYEKELELSKSNYEQMRRIRHDIKNQMAYMSLMLRQKDYSALEKYFNGFNESVVVSFEQIECENVVVRNILNLENAKAKEHNVRIDSKLIIPDIIDGIQDCDLTALLLNLLDNAIEACALDECFNAVIRLNMQQKDKKLFINVTNPVKDKKRNKDRLKLITWKADKDTHGHGMKIIRSITEKYNGAVIYKIINDLFVIDIVLMLA